jgi:putative NADPH-quinone reductase
MNILIVTAHPSSTGITHSIASTYAEAKRVKGHAVEVVNLYAKEYRLDLLNFENIKEFSPRLSTVVLRGERGNAFS